MPFLKTPVNITGGNVQRLEPRAPCCCHHVHVSVCVPVPHRYITQSFLWLPGLCWEAVMTHISATARQSCVPILFSASQVIMSGQILYGSGPPPPKKKKWNWCMNSNHMRWVSLLIVISPHKKLCPKSWTIWCVYYKAIKINTIMFHCHLLCVKLLCIH